MSISEQQLKTLSDALVPVLKERYGIVDQTTLDKALADIVHRTDTRMRRQGKSASSLSTIIRGLRVKAGLPPLNESSAQTDVNYLESVCQKVLVTTGPPGQYLIPTIF